MKMSEAARQRLTDYAQSLNHRLRLKQEWILRHPDYQSGAYILDCINHDKGEPISGTTTFNADDPQPNTSDVITAERFADILNLLLSISTND